MQIFPDTFLFSPIITVGKKGGEKALLFPIKLSPHKKTGCFEKERICG
jgi:hypothetical protein